MTSNKLTIGIADMKMAQREGELITYALGSCVGVCLYDPVIKLGALVHVMLPINMETQAGEYPACKRGCGRYRGQNDVV